MTFRDWTVRYWPAKRTPTRIYLLLHGWTGDENSMDVFSHALPDDCVVLAPRAPYRVLEGGYSWRELGQGARGFPTVSDLYPAAESMLLVLEEWAVSERLDASQFNVIGFSQGAAMAYVFAALYPERVLSVVALSGFLPSGTQVLLAQAGLRGKPVFIAHGSQDEVVPVERARQAVHLLEKSGAKVYYCETEGGHKVSKQCLKGMENFLESAKIMTYSKKENK